MNNLASDFEISFKNVTWLLDKYQDDLEMCKRIIDTVIHTDATEIPDLKEIIESLQRTTYYKYNKPEENIDFLKLNELHPIHLILGIKEGIQKFKQLYNLYCFQNAEDYVTRVELIRMAENDPAITMKQAEIYAWHLKPFKSQDILLEFEKTKYSRNKFKSLFGIEDREELSPMYLVICMASIARGKKLLNIKEDSLSFEDIKAPNTLGLFYLWAGCKEYINIAIELLRQPIQLSLDEENRRFERIRKVINFCQAFGGDVRIEENRFHLLKEYRCDLLDGKITVGDYQTENIQHSTQVKMNYLLKNKFRNYLKSANEHKICINILGFENVNIKKHYKEFWEKPIDKIQRLPVHFKLSLPPQTQNWSNTEVFNFASDFLIQLGYKQNRQATFICEDANKQRYIEIFLENISGRDKHDQCISMATHRILAKRILSSLEKKYKISNSLCPSRNRDVMQNGIEKYLNEEASNNLQSKDRNKGKRL